MRDQIKIGKMFVVFLIAIASATHAGQVRVAVATNFLATLKVLAPIYEQQSGDQLIISAASSGKLFAKIMNGAPYDLFLSADRHYPDRLIEKNRASACSRFLYAKGVLVLWSRVEQSIDESSLHASEVKHIAIANPKIAPYGAAAQQVLEKVGLLDNVKPKLVQGESIGQAFQFVVSGNAQLGFVALSQVLNPNNHSNNKYYWRIPADYHTPIDQEAVLLKHGENNAAAQGFLNFLKSDVASNVISQYGYH